MLNRFPSTVVNTNFKINEITHRISGRTNWTLYICINVWGLYALILSQKFIKVNENFFIKGYHIDYHFKVKNMHKFFSTIIECCVAKSSGWIFSIILGSNMISSYIAFPGFIKVLLNIIGILSLNDFDKCFSCNVYFRLAVVYVEKSCETLNFFFPRLNAVLQYIRIRVSILQSFTKV